MEVGGRELGRRIREEEGPIGGTHGMKSCGGRGVTWICLSVFAPAFFFVLFFLTICRKCAVIFLGSSRFLSPMFVAEGIVSLHSTTPSPVEMCVGLKFLN